MTGIVAIVAIHVSLAAPTSYARAHADLMKSGKPLVVLVGADWCPGCQTMKTAVTPEVRRRGGFKDVGFAIINSDDQPTLAQKLMRGNSIPQLVMYRKTAKGWRRSRLTGAQSVSSVESFIKEGLDDAIIKTPAENASLTQ